MSDKPLGPGWWLASDGTWHPPELHPSMAEASPAPAPASDVLTGDPSEVAAAAAAAAAALDPTGAGQTPPTAMPSMPAMGADAGSPTAQTVEDAPSLTVDTPPLGPVPPRPVPSLSDVPKRPGWTGESDRRQEAGPMFPDLFQQAVSGTALANAVTVNFADGEHRESLDVPMASGPVGESPELVGAGGRLPAEVGAFTGASAKKRRWRL